LIQQGKKFKNNIQYTQLMYDTKHCLDKGWLNLLVVMGYS